MLGEQTASSTTCAALQCCVIDGHLRAPLLWLDYGWKCVHYKELYGVAAVHVVDAHTQPLGPAASVWLAGWVAGWLAGLLGGWLSGQLVSNRGGHMGVNESWVW